MVIFLSWGSGQGNLLTVLFGNFASISFDIIASEQSVNCHVLISFGIGRQKSRVPLSLLICFFGAFLGYEQNKMSANPLKSRVYRHHGGERGLDGYVKKPALSDNNSKQASIIVSFS